MDFGPYEDEFYFLLTEEPKAEPAPQTAANQIIQGAANARHPILEDDDDQRVIQIDLEAGWIHQHDPPPRHVQVDKDGDSSMDSV